MARRRLLMSALGAACLPVLAAPDPERSRVATAWLDDQGQAWLGLLRVQREGFEVQARLALPGRAHGIARHPDGSLLAAARRPGDWLLRWWPQSGRTQWRWNEPGQHFNGHLLRRADGHWLATETDMDSGEGLLALRDADTLELLDAWPSGGRDPHALLALDGGQVLVANGGLALDAASGRRVIAPGPPDSNLALHTQPGAAPRRWQLDDAWLSIRHLARAPDGRVGIALQAQHTLPAERAAAPLLALWNGDTLHTVAGSHDGGGGYGGDIAATERGLRLSATLAGWVLDWTPDLGAVTRRALPGAGALVGPWCFGREQALGGSGARALPGDCQVDNHAA